MDTAIPYWAYALAATLFGGALVVLLRREWDRLEQRIESTDAKLAEMDKFHRDRWHAHATHISRVEMTLVGNGIKLAPLEDRK